MLSEIDHPKNSARLSLIQEEKNESSQDRDKIIMHVVTMLEWFLIKKKNPCFSPQLWKLEDKISAANCIFNSAGYK